MPAHVEGRESPAQEKYAEVVKHGINVFRRADSARRCQFRRIEAFRLAFCDRPQRIHAATKGVRNTIGRLSQKPEAKKKTTRYYPTSSAPAWKRLRLQNERSATAQMTKAITLPAPRPPANDEDLDSKYEGEGDSRGNSSEKTKETANEAEKNTGSSEHDVEDGERQMQVRNKPAVRIGWTNVKKRRSTCIDSWLLTKASKIFYEGTT